MRCRKGVMVLVDVIDIKARCRSCSNLVFDDGVLFCSKMTSDKSKEQMRDITKHVKDPLFAARCNKYISKEESSE